MANPSLTPNALRSLILEVVSEVLASKPASARSVSKPKAKIDCDALCIKAFAKAGFGQVKPRIDTKTYNLWIADGLRVKPGEKSIKCGSLRLFHKSQCEPIQPEPAPKAKPA